MRPDMISSSIGTEGQVADPQPELSLEERLERANRALVCAQMIDNYARMQSEVAIAQRVVDGIRALIAQADTRSEEEQLRSAVADLGDRHAG